MPRPYSGDLRVRVLQDCEEGMEVKEVARKNRVGPTFIYDLQKRLRETGSIEPGQMGGHRKSALEGDKEKIRQLLEQKPDMTLQEIKDELGTKLSIQAISNFLVKMGYSYKKKRYKPASANGLT